ncbi:MAG: prenyltransferase/squalene oxidase repeat-containing protein [Pseudomonadota bacterium]|nr:prenyltransferase/squalene oxidase repeat-containing protein [Pseudomonadota bacterium]
MLKKIVQAPLRYRLWSPVHLGLIAQSALKIDNKADPQHLPHLIAAIDWLCRAQDVRQGCADEGGVSAGWSFEDGWLPSYPETSGYIVETFLQAAEVLDRPNLVERARRILDWELSLQHADGAFPGHFGEPGSRPVIFNTGQIMHGLNHGHRQLQHQGCLDAAVRAGRWMLAQQDEDGCWRRSVHNGIAHTYNTRAAWALLQTGLLAGEPALIEGAKRNLAWALSQQNPAGWFANNAFTVGAVPFTHTIAYAIRGVLESGLLLEDTHLISAAERSAVAVAAALPQNGALAGTLDDQWRPRANYVCLTGLAQMCIIWSRLIERRANQTFQDAVDRGLDYLKRHQRRTGDGRFDDGAIAGSAPFWGDYSRFEFPNWAAKFFADALMLDNRLQGTEGKHG